MNVKVIVGRLLYAGVLVGGTTGLIKQNINAGLNHQRREVRDSYNLTQQEFAKIDKSISNSGKSNYGKCISWEKAIDSLDRRNASLDVAVKQRMLQVGDSLAKIMKNVKVK